MISPRHIPVILTVSLIPTAAMAPAAIYTFQSINAPSSISTLAYDVNDSGQIVGYYQDGVGEHGFMLSDGVFSTMDFPGALYITQTLGTNNTGQIVGSYQPSTGTGSKGFINNTSETTPIRDINNLGQTVGPATPVSYPGATMTFAEGLNDYQHIVGGYALNGTQHAYLDINGVYTPIDVSGAVYTIAFGINNTDQIVGNFIDGNSPNHHGFVYDNGVFQTVDFPGSTETEIFGINNLGDIVGMYRDSSGLRGFFAHDPPAAVPEPPSWLLLLTGLLALPIFKRKQMTSDSFCIGTRVQRGGQTGVVLDTGYSGYLISAHVKPYWRQIEFDEPKNGVKRAHVHISTLSYVV